MHCHAHLNGVLQGENSSLGLGLVSNVGVLLVHADHDSRVLGPSDNGREDSPGGVISGESSLAHSTSVVYDKGGNIFFSHS